MAKMKLKTHSGAKKRFKLTKNGKIKRGHAFRSHILTMAVCIMPVPTPNHLRHSGWSSQVHQVMRQAVPRLVPQSSLMMRMSSSRPRLGNPGQKLASAESSSPAVTRRLAVRKRR